MKPARRRASPVADATWHCYLVRCADGTLYCGVTSDVAKRVAAHNAGKGAKYTAPRTPVTLVWSEACGTRGDALRRELAIKAMSRASKLRLARAA